MLLSLLDTPFALFELKAFSLPGEDARTLRAAVATSLARGDSGALRSLYASRVKPTPPGFIVQRQAIAGLAERAAALARAANLELSLPPISDAPTTRLSGPAWLLLAQAIAALPRPGSPPPPIIVESRVQVAAEALEACATGQLPDELPAQGPAAIDWVAGLTLPSPLAADALLPSPAQGGFEPDWEVSVQEAALKALSQLAIGDVLDVLVGEFLPSHGPGPFLALPEHGARLLDAGSARLPLFTIDGLELPDVRLLEGATLAAEQARVQSATPGLGWQRERLGDVELDEAAVIDAWWPRLKERYLGLLEHAAANDRSVLLLEGGFDHAFWVSTDWWVRQ
jgi:hypothetical protein